MNITTKAIELAKITIWTAKDCQRILDLAYCHKVDTSDILTNHNKLISLARICNLRNAYDMRFIY